MNIFLTLIAIAILVTFVYSGWRGAPWVPTRKKDVERFLALAQIQRGQKMYDLGCGDGRLVCAAAQAGANAQGFELSLLPYVLAQTRRFFHPARPRIKISFRDIWHVNLSDADIIYMFLMPKVYSRLREKFEKELRPGTKVIAYVWPIDGWIPAKVDKHDRAPVIYLYNIPL